MKVRAWLDRWRRPHPVMVAGNAVTLLHDGEQCYPAMLEAIASASEEILFEMYWFASDRTGRVFADALAAKAAEGVRVHVIFDAVGSWEADRSMFAEMRAAGCQVHEYNPIAPFRKRFRLGVVNRRDHRKILVVDGHIAMTGGVNIGDPWAPVEDGGAGWRDDMIRIDGPAAGQMRALFMRTWTDLGLDQPSFSHVLSDSEVQAQYGDCPVRVVTNARFGERRAMRRAYIEQIQAARSHIFVANSYFVPDRVVRRELANAVARGVDVRILVPGRSDVIAVHYASRRLYGWLMRHGIKLYQWQRTGASLQDGRHRLPLVHRRYLQPRLPVMALQPGGQRDRRG